MREKLKKSITKWKLWFHFTKTGERLKEFPPNWKMLTLHKGEEKRDIEYWFKCLSKNYRIERDTERTGEIKQICWSTCNKITVQSKIVKKNTFKLLTCKQGKIRLQLSFSTLYWVLECNKDQGLYTEGGKKK